jgi:hypothetical protein
MKKYEKLKLYAAAAALYYIWAPAMSGFLN